MIKAGDGVVSWRIRAKQKLISYKGGKCLRCGYNKIECPRAFSFHHRSPSEKDFTISAKSWSLDRLKKEVDKCDLLCVRCHAEVHDEQDKARRKCLKLSERKYLSSINCMNCKEEFQPNDSKQKFCTPDCYYFSRRKVERPSKEELTELLKTHNMCEVGRRFGVSDNTIRKWLKRNERR